MKKDKFWINKKLTELSHSEWESLCDNCGKCCVIKLQNKKNNEVFYTNISCKLLDTENCKCMDYSNRKKRNKVSVKANEINLSNIPEEIYNNILISEKIDAAKLDGRVSMRVSTYDRMPMMGSIDENLFILSALGARGMIMGPLLGDALVSIILNQPIGLDNEILRACDPNRIERSFLV